MSTDTAAELSRRRARFYHVRIADDPVHIARFVVVCPRHKVVGSDLTILEARGLLAEHVESHEA